MNVPNVSGAVKLDGKVFEAHRAASKSCRYRTIVERRPVTGGEGTWGGLGVQSGRTTPGPVRRQEAKGPLSFAGERK